MSKYENSRQQNAVQLSPRPFENKFEFGYEVDDITKISEKYRCIICSLVIRDPIQLTECGHRSCRECIQNQASLDTEEGIICPVEDCHEVTEKKQLMFDKAFKKELDQIQVGCKHRSDSASGCTWTGILLDYQKHLDEFHISYNCPMCKSSFSSKEQLDEHLIACSEQFTECRLGITCTKDIIHKDEYLNHLLGAKHQESIIKHLNGEIPISAPSDQQEGNQVFKEWETNITEKLDRLSEELRRLQTDSAQLDQLFNSIYQQFTNIVQDVNILRTSVNGRISMRQNIQPTQKKLQQEIEEAHKLSDETQVTYTDGTLTWRIDNVSEKLADAQSERQTSIFSPTFYSSPCGYRMRSRLFLFGDGNARRTHISIFFQLMKGEYDAILKWPFHYKVTFCLLDQTGQNHHVIDSFYPDVKSNSFQRPREATNIASGIPKFCPLPMLLQDDNSFVRDNTLFIRIIIALNETPRSILPYMLTLNPALPAHVQETLITQESAKQQTAAATSS